MIVPQADSTLVTFAPQRSATSHMRVPKTPLTPMMTSSPGFDEIDAAKFHAGAASAADGKRHVVLGLENFAKHRLDLFHHFDEDGIEVADERLGHGMQHGRRDIAWPRA